MLKCVNSLKILIPFELIIPLPEIYPKQKAKSIDKTAYNIFIVRLFIIGKKEKMRKKIITLSCSHWKLWI